MNKNCLTIKLLTDASGCLAENPTCEHARQLGFSFICCHPDHTHFHAHVVGGLTRDEALRRYNALRQRRRNEFVAELDKESRKYFCHRTDFHGRPLPEQVSV